MQISCVKRSALFVIILINVVKMEVGTDMLARFFLCETTPAEEKAIVSWLDKDESHRKEFDSMDAAFSASVLYGNTRTRKRRFFSTASGRFAIIAACVVLVTVLSLVGGNIYSNYRFDKRAAQLVEMSVPDGQRINVVLSDGTYVTLKSGASIQYPTIFGDKTRLVVLKGDAMFDVAHDAKHPFIVRAAGHMVQALGTKFTVSADDASSAFSASLLEGSILVSNIASGDSMVLEPGEKVTVRNGRMVKEMYASNDEEIWSDGIIVLDGQTFGEVMTRYEKAYGFNIIYRTDKMPQIRCKGKIRVADGIEHSLAVLKKGGTRFNYEIDYSLKEIYIW